MGALADSCSDCTAVVSTIAARLSSEESIAAQQGILVGGLCPTAEDVAGCEASLPGFWAAIAELLRPGYWDPTADWMCAPSCAAPEDTVMTCDDCTMGIQMAIDQLLGLMVTSHRLATPLWKALALPGSSGFSE